MNKSRNRRSRHVANRNGRWAILLTVLAGAPIGCTREFFREWANQDVSEAVFEKSRDPRYRLDMFSIQPPALARFADPYNRDPPPPPPPPLPPPPPPPPPHLPPPPPVLPAVAVPPPHP